MYQLRYRRMVRYAMFAIIAMLANSDAAEPINRGNQQAQILDKVAQILNQAHSQVRSMAPYQFKQASEMLAKEIEQAIALLRTVIGYESRAVPPALLRIMDALTDSDLKARSAQSGKDIEAALKQINQIMSTLQTHTYQTSNAPFK